jgi:hypothetical protein
MRRRRRLIDFHDFRALGFGSAEELIAAYGSLDRAQRVWRAVRAEFLQRWDLWGMPETWWRFEPGIPEELRSGPAMILSRRDADEWTRIESARREYLVSIGIDPMPPRRRITG